MEFTDKTVVGANTVPGDADALLGIDIGSTTVKIAILDGEHHILFSDYERHYANIRETLSGLLEKARKKLGNINFHPMITGSGGLTLASCLEVPFIQEVISVASALQEIGRAHV